MTEAQAWREIARQFHGCRSERSRSGLCIAVSSMQVDNLVFYRMIDRVSSYQTDCGWAYPRRNARGDYLGNDNSREARDARCMAALWLALDAEAEE